MKKYLLITGSLAIYSMLFSAGVEAFDACVSTAPGVVNVNTAECATKADSQFLTLLKVKLCAVEPTLVEAPAEVMNTAGCETIFSNAAGARIEISDKPVEPANEIAQAQIDSIPPKTWTFLYAEMSNIFEVTKIQTFSDTMTDVPLVTNPVTAPVAGLVCWTKTRILNNFRNTTTGAAGCGTQAQATAGVGITQSRFNVVDGVQAELGGLNNIQDSMYVTLAETGNEFACALLNDNNVLQVAPAVNQNGTATKLACWKPVNIKTYAAGRTQFTFAAPYTLGTNINTQGLNSRILNNFGTADFDLAIGTVEIKQ